MTAETVENANPEAGVKNFFTKGLDVFRHTEDSVAKSVKAAEDAGKSAEVITKLKATKLGGPRWGRIAMVGVPVAALGAMFLAGTGNQGPGENAARVAESKDAAQEQGASVA